MNMHESVGDKNNFWKVIFEADQKKYVIATSVSADRARKSQNSMH